MTYINKIASLLCLIGIGFSSLTYAADVSLTMRAEKEVPVTIQGATVPMLKPVRRINVGDVILLTLTYKNNEAQEAYNVNIDNPIPAGTRFVRGTGQGKGAVFLVSYDEGASYEEDVRIHDTPVTNVRWRFENLPANSEGEVSFELQVEKADHKLMR
ncbi:MAG: DUF11 domain-containing protein [Agitococcus sp.]|jgi:uncharacterized repeat protein (TIGR01451 family)|nr:DUF11 domain-containing protein [Moraxellaceae bacterium]MBP9216391.1 DUF11 domain-containing protein [Agitococcus sp.]MCC6375347.1 DUF11 domain-containing protein [Moraxellaceae bacterium]HQV80291.1 hypothetical protein [Agitococcus sp.]